MIPNSMVHVATYESLIVSSEKVANVENRKIVNQTAIKPLQFTNRFFIHSLLYQGRNKYGRRRLFHELRHSSTVLPE